MPTIWRSCSPAPRARLPAYMVCSTRWASPVVVEDLLAPAGAHHHENRNVLADVGHRQSEQAVGQAAAAEGVRADGERRQVLPARRLGGSEPLGAGAAGGAAGAATGAGCAARAGRHCSSHQDEKGTAKSGAHPAMISAFAPSINPPLPPLPGGRGDHLEGGNPLRLPRRSAAIRFRRRGATEGEIARQFVAGRRPRQIGPIRPIRPIGPDSLRGHPLKPQGCCTIFTLSTAASTRLAVDRSAASTWMRHRLAGEGA